MDLIDFREEYCESTDFKHLCVPFTYYVPGRGSERPTVMLLGDYPTAVDNNERKALSGQTGRVLDQLMALAALSANPDEIPNAYITHMVKYRTSAGKLSGPEIERSLAWVRKEWKVLRRPPVIVTMGIYPLRCLLGPVKLGTAVGNPHPIAAGGPTVWPMFNPAYAMNTPEIRPACEEHWHALGAWLKEEGLV